MDRGQREMEYAVERYQRNGRGVAQQNGRGVAQQNGRPYSHYDQVTSFQRQASYPGQLPVPGQMSTEKDSNRNSPRVHQNAAAIMNYNKLEKGKVREGRHAAAVAQLHQNDLHNIDTVGDLVPFRENGAANDLAVVPADRSKNYIKQHLNLQSKFSRAQSTPHQQQSPGKSQSNGYHDSDLSSSFDPMKDRHMWTMWRTAVNGRIVDEVRQLERIKSERGPMAPPYSDQMNPGMYGKALVAPPLKRFIRFDAESKAIANQMSSVGQGTLETSQFVYYGLPRVYVSHARK